MTSVLDQGARQRVGEWLRSAATQVVTSRAPLEVHIDELSPLLHDKASWVQGGFELLEVIACVGELRGKSYVVCLVFHLDPQAAVAGIGVNEPPRQWTNVLGITPPELVLMRSEDWIARADYLRDCGRLLGSLAIGGLPAAVYLTERVDRYDKEAEQVRHIWLVLAQAVPTGGRAR